jgi:nicotinamide phosphoribosyltransferase
MCAGGKDTELETYRRLITEIYPSGIVSIVSDTWDFWNAVTNIASELKEEIISRKPDALGFAKVVFRPDSGNPLFVICGNPEAPEGSPEYKGAVQCLWEIFGGTTTSTGHKLLSQNVGLIYGDSITPQLCEEILKTLHSKGFASANLVFGIGSYTYQYNTRDTLGFAMKATLIERNGVRIPIFKDPVTDTSKTKKSAKGLLAVQDQDGELVLLDNLDERPDNDQLQTVFIDGTLVTESIELIRTRLR